MATDDRLLGASIARRGSVMVQTHRIRPKSIWMHWTIYLKQEIGNAVTETRFMLSVGQFDLIFLSLEHCAGQTYLPKTDKL